MFGVMMMVNKKQFKFTPFSRKQKQILTWWLPSSGHADKNAIICDGSVRSGKTIIMSLAYVMWAMASFDGCNFGMAGKTIGSFKRNVWFLLKIMLFIRGYKLKKISDVGDNVFSISKGGKENYFYLFGGKDESSQDLVQGFTAAGFFFDEVTLMPETFVNQAVARCSEEGAKFWFNCNPDGPFHWFKVDWIDKLDEKKALRIHFNLDDNPTLSEKVKDRYRKMFSGIFYQRFVLGLWVLAEGIIYSMFRKEMIIKKIPDGVKILKKWVGVDYGQSNATVFLLIGLGSDSNLYILNEYYHSGKKSSIQKSPLKYAKDFKRWLFGMVYEKFGEQFEYIFIDPSAKGFMLQLHEEGIRKVRAANNEVIKGIELISSLLDNNRLFVLDTCVNTIKEFSSYSWDSKAQARGEDKPMKDHDHCMDSLRYVVNGTRMVWQRLVIGVKYD